MYRGSWIPYFRWELLYDDGSLVVGRKFLKDGAPCCDFLILRRRMHAVRSTLHTWYGTSTVQVPLYLAGTPKREPLRPAQEPTPQDAMRDVPKMRVLY